MKIAYFDLGITDFFEDYSINPKGYGGGPCFARFAKEQLQDFYIIGQKENFTNVSEKENQQSCISVPKDILNLIRQGYPPVLLIPELQTFDIFIHHHDCLWINPLNSKAKSIHWSLSGKADGGHPSNDCDLLYTKSEKSYWTGQKIEYIQIGKPVPLLQKYEKKDFIFQCSRHDELMNTIEVAQNCIRHNIKGYFAGPINNGYNLLDFVDNKTTFYLGLISEDEKLEYCKAARLTTYLHKWQTVFNQSVIESWGVGTPILANNVGFFKEILRDSSNGFVYNGNFLDAYLRAKDINPMSCWQSADQFNVERMINSFLNVFNKVCQ